MHDRRPGWQDGTVDAIVCTADVPSGDTVLDLEAGSNAGAGIVVGVLSWGVPREVLAAAPHTRLIPSVASLPDVLAGI